MEAAGLASAIITFLDLTAKIVSRTQEFLNQAENAPAFLKGIGNRLPLLERSLRLINEEILLQRISDDLERSLLRIIDAARVELQRLDGYVVVLSPQHGSSKLQTVDRAFKSVFKYESKINAALEKLNAYEYDLVLLQVSIISGRTGRTEENTLKILNRFANDDHIVETKRERDAILAWLDGIPRDDCIDICLMRRSVALSKWLFETQAYLEWQSGEISGSPTRFLWVHGPAGCGKTFTAATVFDCFEDHQIEAAAVFWKAGKQFEHAALDEIPRSWVQQLLLKHDSNYEHVKPVYTRSRSPRASPQEVWEALKCILESTTSVGITLVLDGLDVYREQQAKREELFPPGSPQLLQHVSIREFLETLKNTLEGQECRFICFSQPDADIRSQLSPSQMSVGIPSYIDAWQHVITANDIEEGLFEVAFEMVNERLPRKRYDFRVDFARLIAEQAGAHMSITIMQRQIKRLKPTFSEQKLRKMLEEPFDCLEDVYQNDLKRIKKLPSDEQHRAWLMLHWITYSIRLLTVQELLEAIHIEHDVDEFPVEELSDLEDEAVYGEIKELCGNFVVFEPGEHPDEHKFWKIRLVHQSAKEFLVQNICTVQQHQTPTPFYAGLPLWSLCIRYLTYNNIWPPSHTSDGGTSQISLPAHPFLKYAATYFHHHVRSCADEDRPEVDRSLAVFLDQHFDKFSTWHRSVRACNKRERAGVDTGALWDWSDRLAFAAATGLLDVVRQWQATDEITPSQLSQGLCAACWSGSITMVRELLDQGADLNQIAINGCSPLHVAAHYGRVDVLAYLLERGADPDVATDCGVTALHCAVEEGHEQIVRVLISHGADAAIARTDDGFLPLHLAVQLRDLQCVKAVVNTNSNASHTLNATTLQGWSALGIAVSQSDLETDRDIVKLLLLHGASPVQMFSDGRDPFFICAEQGNQDLFEILGQQDTLLQQSINTTTYKEGQSLLHAAVLGEYCDIVQMVLAAGADWSVRNDKGQTALDLAELHALSVRTWLALRIVKSENGMAFLANKLATSPPEDPEIVEEFMDVMYDQCLKKSLKMPEILATHLETCQDGCHKRTEEIVKSWAATE